MGVPIFAHAPPGVRRRAAPVTGPFAFRVHPVRRRAGDPPSVGAVSRSAERGQAAVESIGIAVLVALLLAAVSAWLVREVRPPAGPPALVEAVAAPLSRDPAPFDHRYPLPPPAFEMPRGRDDEPIGRALRAAARGSRDAVVLGVEMRHRFARGFGRRVGARGRRFLEDPLGELLTVPDADLLTPAGARLDVERLRDYVRELRAMPPREAALRVSEDAGGLGGDLAVEAVKAWLERRAQPGGRQPRTP